jgi:hypothetical protein
MPSYDHRKSLQMVHVVAPGGDVSRVVARISHTVLSTRTASVESVCDVRACAAVIPEA